jgi:hypothetical protein
MEKESDTFERIPTIYSEQLNNCITSCLAYDPSYRPDLMTLLQRSKPHVALLASRKTNEIEAASKQVLDIHAIRDRVEAAAAQLREREQRRGKGVTKEAQDLFDAFSRVLPARWDGTSIIVADAVIISEPYRVENCQALTVEDGGVSASSTLRRVRKVVSSYLFSISSLPMRRGIQSYSLTTTTC